MKSVSPTIKSLFAGIACLFALPLFSQDRNNFVWPVKLQKDYSKTYPLGGESVAVMSRYGEMKIETWDKNEVKVDAHISVGAQSNEYAKEVLDRINITDKKEDNKVVFLTEFTSWVDNSNSGGREMHVDVTIHLPANAKLYAENNYGPLTMGDYKGELELVCKYGTFTGGKISHAKSITVDYGKAIIDQVSDSKLMFKYSKVDINKVAGEITGEFQYCSSIDMPIDNTLKKLELKNNYTSLYLMVPRDMSAEYDITTNNAKLTAKNDLLIKETVTGATDSRVSSFNPVHTYVGSLGKGGGAQIHIKSSYGNIRVM